MNPSPAGPESARIVMDTLRDINQNDGITVVVTLHQVDYALRYCERIVALRRARLLRRQQPTV